MPRSRRSHFIRQRPASNVYHAARVAEAKGFPMTHFVTINFSMAGLSKEEVSEAFRWVRSRWADWSRRPSRKSQHGPVAPHDSWVIEGAGGVSAAHWMVHLTPGRIEDFKKRLKDWMRRVAKEREFPADTIDVKTIYSAKGATKYLLEGIDPTFATNYGVRAKDQGLVIGKRSGQSRTVGPAMKKQMRKEGTYPTANAWATRQAQKTKHQARPA